MLFNNNFKFIWLRIFRKKRVSNTNCIMKSIAILLSRINYYSLFRELFLESYS